MIQALRKSISVCLLAVFIIGITPDEFIHLFVHHCDTIHDGSLATTIGAKHIHCKSLQNTLPVFSQSESYYSPEVAAVYSATYFIETSPDCKTCFLNPSERGPPSASEVI